MKVLIASWTWYPVGGDWTYIENLQKLYISKGFEVVPFSTKNPKNIKTPYDRYFVQSFDYKQLNKEKNVGNGIKALKNAIVSKEAVDNLELLLQENKIAFAHLHIIHHFLTPSIIRVLDKYKIPVIWSLHDYKILCPEGSFTSNGKICEKCANGKFYNCALNRCKKQSLLASLLASVDAYYHRHSDLYNKVAFFLCPSSFIKTKFEQFGMDKEKLILSNLCYDIGFLDNQIIQLKNKRRDGSDKKYIFYVGRVERYKGIFTLLDAVSNTDVVLKIAGTGSAFEEVRRYIEDNGIGNVELLGFCSKDTVYKLTMEAAFVVCPSETYEIFGYSICESQLLSKAVVGASIGGIPELVVHNQTGLLFEPGNTSDLKEKILHLWNNEELASTFGEAGRKHAITKVSFEAHWQKLESILMRIGVIRDRGVEKKLLAETWQEELF